MSYHCACRFEDGPNDNPGNGPAIYKCGFHANKEREAAALHEQLADATDDSVRLNKEKMDAIEGRIAAEQQLAESNAIIKRMHSDNSALTVQLAAEKQRAAQIERETIERCAEVCDELGNIDGYVTRGYWACEKAIRALASAAESAGGQVLAAVDGQQSSGVNTGLASSADSVGDDNA